MAWRWLWLLVPVRAGSRATAAGPGVGLGAILHVFFVSTFVGTFLPASVGGDAVRATALGRLGVPLADAVASVFMDRVLGVLGVLAMAVVGLWLARDLPARPGVVAAVLAALAVTAAGCAAVAAAVFSTRVAAFLIALVQRLPWARVARRGLGGRRRRATLRRAPRPARRRHAGLDRRAGAARAPGVVPRPRPRHRRAALGLLRLHPDHPARHAAADHRQRARHQPGGVRAVLRRRRRRRAGGLRPVGALRRPRRRRQPAGRRAVGAQRPDAARAAGAGAGRRDSGSRSA